MTVLVDSDVLIDLGAERADAVDALNLLAPGGLAFSIVSYGELYEGVLGASDPLVINDQFDRLLSLMQMIEVDFSILRTFAGIRRSLRQRGQLIGDMDIVIAATAIEHNLRLITRNRKHFERVPGLRFFTPQEILNG